MTVNVGLLVMVLALGFGLVFGTRLIRERRADPAPVPQLRVVTPGLPGSGKNLVLTSMDQRLQAPGDRGYHIEAPREQNRELEFAVMTGNDDSAQTVLKLGYQEYPGELLTHADQPGPAALKDADALIGIIDGLRLLQAYRGERRGEVFLTVTVDSMAHTMREARCPITFVITEWDLLDELHPDENARLRLVRTQLMGIQGFRDLIKIDGTRRVIRLVPVTANVDLALAMVVPDVVAQVELSGDLTSDARRRVVHELQRQVTMLEAKLPSSRLTSGY